ncbi:hypothetical protein [uncultured Tateyamaria sp.]|uniref:hypothetical protein n=1 Tax=uncultured Tateyamaria sp. TaxID=455651 RepID=UPI002615646D|nr:hypothetical protein [uncultured Tateyamaria sp.]
MQIDKHQFLARVTQVFARKPVLRVDVLLVGDFRFPGGTSTSIVSDVKALHGAGYRVGLLAYASNLFDGRRSFHPGIRALAEDGLACLVPPGQPVEAELCCLHHPAVFEHLPALPLEISCPRFVMIVHHPPIDAYGNEQYNLLRSMRITEAQFGHVVWAPVGPKVRGAFKKVALAPALTQSDWVNTIDADGFRKSRPRLKGQLPVLGRHSRPGVEKWPDSETEFKNAYPEAEQLRVRLMGWGNQLDEIVEERPQNWDVLPFGAMPVEDFLAGLDYFSYFHSEVWAEAFGRSILEAMAAGLVCFLPEHFEPLFRHAAVYCEPIEVLDKVLGFENNPKAYTKQSERAVEFVKSHFGPDKSVARVAAMIGPPNRLPQATAARKAGVLYLTSNGVGMGHITRCLATARRLSDQCDPVIVTMSKAFGVAETQGFKVEYLPFFRSIGIEYSDWNQKLSAELDMVLRFHRPNVLVLDGNVPYDPLLRVLPDFPQMWSVWQRRPLWPADVGEEFLQHASRFDTVLEPGELAAPVDRGPTVGRRVEARQVPSIRYLDQSEILDRKAARALIGLDPDRPAFVLQLGSGNNFDMQGVLKKICSIGDPALQARPIQLVFARWRITQKAPELPAFVKTLDAFPISKLLNAFDGAIALAGYNTFHENIAAALPTLFTANQHPEQDEQWLRADYAAQCGLALSARSYDAVQFERALRRLLDPKTRETLRLNCNRAKLENGAQQAANLISTLAMTRKPSGVAFHAV